MKGLFSLFFLIAGMIYSCEYPSILEESLPPAPIKCTSEKAWGFTLFYTGNENGEIEPCG
jgi:hypothetical protein